MLLGFCICIGNYCNFIDRDRIKNIQKYQVEGLRENNFIGITEFRWLNYLGVRNYNWSSWGHAIFYIFGWPWLVYWEFVVSSKNFVADREYDFQ